MSSTSGGATIQPAGSSAATSERYASAAEVEEEICRHAIRRPRLPPSGTARGGVSSARQNVQVGAVVVVAVVVVAVTAAGMFVVEAEDVANPPTRKSPPLVRPELPPAV